MTEQRLGAQNRAATNCHPERAAKLPRVEGTRSRHIGAPSFAGANEAPCNGSAVALEHQGAGKRTMPAPPRKLKLNPKKGGIVFLNHLCISRGDQGVFEGSMVPAPFPTSRAIGRATCKRLSRKGGRGESSEQAWGGREVAFAPAHLAQSNKPSRDLNLLAGFPDHPITRSPDYPILLSDTPQRLRGGAENNPIKSVRMSHAPAVPPRPLIKATADDVVSGVIQATKRKRHKRFLVVSRAAPNRGATNRHPERAAKSARAEGSKSLYLLAVTT
jgi:hypothetical protein